VGVTELRAPDGRLVRSFRFGEQFYFAGVNWAKDGSRLAIAQEPTLRVFDTVTGALVLRRRVGALELTNQPFAPDGSALLMSDYGRIVRVALPSGHMTTLDRSFADEAAWSRTGRIRVRNGRRVRILGNPDVRFRLPRWDVGFMRWKADGETLMFDFSVAADECSAARNGVAEVVPGQQPRGACGGAGREETMNTVRHGLTRVAVDHSELYDTGSGDAIADELSRWLRGGGPRADRSPRRAHLLSQARISSPCSSSRGGRRRSEPTAGRTSGTESASTIGCRPSSSAIA